MSIAGIICEYNPFHNGHEYLVKKAKKDGCAVVAVMSGSYTQRGELAITDKYTRAEMAIKCGVDLVLELPFPFAMSSAEFFAKGGISVLERIGADRIYFGSESGDVEFIKEAAKAASSEDFTRIKSDVLHSEGAAKVYFDTLGEIMGRECEMLSNDILAVQYVKEINRRGLDIELCAVKRVGDRYNDKDIRSEFASATAIREILATCKSEELEKYMPAEALKVLNNSIAREETPVDVKKVETALLSFWRMVNPDLLLPIAELGNGLEYRIKDAALSSATIEEFEKNAATKKYTSAKIRRAMLYALFGVTKTDLDGEPEYTSLLAANSVGRAILSSLRRDNANLPIVTKSADAPDCRQRELSQRADELWTLAMPNSQNSAYLSKKKIYIE